jgi:hypothetical protein
MLSILPVTFLQCGPSSSHLAPRVGIREVGSLLLSSGLSGALFLIQWIHYLLSQWRVLVLSIRQNNFKELDILKSLQQKGRKRSRSADTPRIIATLDASGTISPGSTPQSSPPKMILKLPNQLSDQHILWNQLNLLNTPSPPIMLELHSTNQPSIHLALRTL